MTAAHRFTDRDVRERPDLIAHAIRYLRWYQGDFQFLLDAKFYEQQHGELPLTTVRGVLNCLRQDARYALVAGELPVPYETAPEPDTPPPAWAPRRRLQVVREQRRLPFVLKATWNARLLYSTNYGVVVHALNLNSRLEYVPNAADERDKYWVRGGLKGLCYASYPGYASRLTRVMPEGMRFCNRCRGLVQEKGYDWGPTAPPDGL